MDGRCEADDDEEEEEALEALDPPPSTAAAAAAAAAAAGGSGDDLKFAIAHVDLDAFYVQVERSLDPSLMGIPAAVIQYNPNGDLADLPVEANRRMDASDGSIIAVSYEARARGVTRIMRGTQARAACPEIALVQVAVKHKKADLTPYRNAGARVIKILARTAPVERASIDECYIDLTQPARALLASGGLGPELISRIRGQTKLAGLEGEGARPPPANADVGDGDGKPPPVVLTREEVRRGHVSQGQQQQQLASALPSPADAWWDRPLALWSPAERLLLSAAAVLYDMRAAVFNELGFTCSGGIAPSKLLAKLASGMNKPNKQTLCLPATIPQLLGPLPIARLKGLGGDFGERVARDLEATTIGEIVAVPQRRLEQLYGESTAEWLWHLVRGVDGEKVEDRATAKSIGCGKTYYRNNLKSFEQIHRWLAQLAGELVERLASDAELNERIPQLLTVSYQAAGLQPPPGPVRPNQPYPGNQNFTRSAPLAVSLEQLQESPQAVQTTLADLALGLVQKWQRQREEQHPLGQGPLPPLRLSTLFLTASKFLEITQKSRITSFFHNAPASAEAGATGRAASSSSSPFKINLPSSASSSPAAKPAAAEAGGAKRKPADGGLGDFLKRKREQPPLPTQQQQGSRHAPPGPEDVDPEVLAALPPDIRKEVEAAIMQQQRQQRPAVAGGGGGGGGKEKEKEKKGQLDSYFARAAAAGAGIGGQRIPPPPSSKPAAKPKPKPKPLDRFLVKKK